MTKAVSELLDALLAWFAERPRSRAEAIEAWRTSCPRLPVWEDAVDSGLVVVTADAVRLTGAGRRRLAAPAD